MTNNNTTPPTVVEQRLCADCARLFSLTEADIQFFIQRGLQIPRRCEPCRHERRRLAAIEGSPDRPGGRR
jgi:hypothetical protein